MHGALARTFALSGKPDSARATLRTLEELSRARYVSPFEFVTIYFALGETGKGFSWLSKACDDRCFELLALKVDPRFEALKDDGARVAAGASGWADARLGLCDVLRHTGSRTRSSTGSRYSLPTRRKSAMSQ